MVTGIESEVHEPMHVAVDALWAWPLAQCIGTYPWLAIFRFAEWACYERV